ATRSGDTFAGEAGDDVKADARFTVWLRVATARAGAYHLSKRFKICYGCFFKMNRPPSAPLDLAALEIFRAVAAQGSVTRAAEQLSRVQSNVTTRVRQLEADLGTVLFLREGKRMALT